MLLACNKNETASTADHRITAASNVESRQDETVDIPLTVTNVSGSAGKITLSVSGLPEKIGYNFSTLSGTADFNSVLHLNIAYAAPAGTYDLLITATSESGMTSTHTIKLKIDTAVDCRLAMVGFYVKVSNQCNRGKESVPHADVIIDEAAGRIKIGQMASSYVIGKVNCEDKSFVVNKYRYAYHDITGTGSYSNDTLTFRLHYQPIYNAPSTYVDCDCTTVLVKN